MSAEESSSTGTKDASSHAAKRPNVRARTTDLIGFILSPGQHTHPIYIPNLLECASFYTKILVYNKKPLTGFSF
jgi:hypothetical protein